MVKINSFGKSFQFIFQHGTGGCVTPKRSALQRVFVFYRNGDCKNYDDGMILELKTSGAEYSKVFSFTSCR